VTRRIGIVLAAALLGAGRTIAQSPSPSPTPLPSGPTETAEVHLAQIDVTVYGPPEAVSSLTADDFALQIQLTKVRSFTVDRLCPEVSAPDAPAASAPTYLFYFDQPHLTFAGRANAIDIARELVATLVDHGARAMIVSNARSVVIVAPLTSDRALLIQALERLENDRTQWDDYAETESLRVAEVTRELNEMQNYDRAVVRARHYQLEERVRSDRDLRRLAATLSQLTEATPPKAVIYFADTMRSNAGEHYMAFFGRQQRGSQLGPMPLDSEAAQLALDRVLNEAAANGIRIHTVEAQGLVLTTDREVQTPLGMLNGGTIASSSRLRTSDAHRTLEGLAAESGGQSFLHGISPAKIGERLASDASCVYLLSFDPTGFAEDEPLRVSVAVRRPGVTQRTRGRLVVASASSRLTSRILRAFAAPDSIADPFEVRTGLIPTGYKDGRYAALLQVAIPGSALTGAAWDLGATLVQREKVRGRAAGHIASNTPGVPVILESEIEIPAGAYDLVAVAHEDRTGLVASSSLKLDWPALKEAHAGIGPIAVVQPVVGAFLRGDATRKSGSVIARDGDPVDPSRPTAVVTVVCPAGNKEATRIVERVLTGPTLHEFPPQDMTGEAACVQLRDVVPSNTLRGGPYRYVLRVVAGEETLAEATREFVVVTGEPASEEEPEP
jgi:VWFA-related protein